MDNEIKNKEESQGWFNRIGLKDGMECPRCGCCDLRADVTKKRNGEYKRIRVCRYCNKRIPTVEHIV